MAGKDTAASIKGAELLIVEAMGHDLPPSLFGFVAGVISDNARRMFNPVNRPNVTRPLYAGYGFDKQVELTPGT